MMNNYSLYIHIPFCKKKCAYCDFYSVCDYSLAPDYIDVLCTQLLATSRRYSNRECISVFIGGGTPTSLEIPELTRLLKAIKKLNIVKGAEFTVEANPATLDEEKLKLLKKYGVNRLSIGLQSANDNELCMLTRIHSYDEFLDTYYLARQYIKNINIDLMYGLPSCCENDTTDIERLKSTLEKVIDLKPSHISFYGLRIEHSTPFGKIKDSLILPSDDSFADMYIMGCDMLKNAGYHKYEISNFSLPDKECRHNLVYWNRGHYIGLGPSAHSFIDGERYAYKKDIKHYINCLKSGYNPSLAEISYIDKTEAMNEEIMLSLRLTNGLDTLAFNQKYGKDIINDYIDIIEGYEKNGYIKRDGAFLSLTDKGMLVSNYIISDFMY